MKITLYDTLILLNGDNEGVEWVRDELNLPRGPISHAQMQTEAELPAVCVKESDRVLEVPSPVGEHDRQQLVTDTEEACVQIGGVGGHSVLLDRIPVQQLSQRVSGHHSAAGLQEAGAGGVPRIVADGVLQGRQLLLTQLEHLPRVVQLVVAGVRHSLSGTAVDHPQVVQVELGAVRGACELVAQQEGVLGEQLDAPHAHLPQQLPAAVQRQQPVR